MNDRKRLQDRTRIIDFESVDLKTARSGTARAHLIVIRGPDLGRLLQISAPVTIGRDRACNLTLTDPGVSGHHARIIPQQPDSYVLADLNSTNGTRVDGKPIKGSWNLRDGEKIFVGESVLSFTEADATQLSDLRDPVMQVGSDSLTGLESKRRFDESLDNALASTRLIRTPLAMQMMDIDNLGLVTASHGRAYSAHCIREAGRIIRQQIGTSGLACRYGGDDFTAFLKGTDRQAAVQVAEGIRTAIANAGLEMDGVALNPTISIGVATFPDDGEWVLDLVAAADRALYNAKAAGKNRVAVS